MSIISAGGAVVGAGEVGAYQISRSLRFNSADSAFLNRTPASASNRKTWTWSGWVKRSGLGTTQQLFQVETVNGGTYTDIKFSSDKLFLDSFGGTGDLQARCVTDGVFRDVSAWYHVVAVLNTANATAADRAILYVNGVRVSQSITDGFDLDAELMINTTNEHRIGADVLGNEGHVNGYLTEIHFIDGQALDETDFGEFSPTTGVWGPIAYTGTYGTNGFFLNFSDNSGVTSTTLGKDQAGSNNWTPNNFSVTAGAGNDSLVDTCTLFGTDTGIGGEVRGNYCVMNPLAVDPGSLPTITNGNLDISVSGALATITMPIGTWYWEATCTSADADQAVGAYSTSETGKASISGNANPTHGFIYQANGNARKNGTVIATFATFTNGAVISFAYDASIFELEVYKNNVLQGTITLSTPPSGDSYVPMACCLSGSFTFNFGQRAFAHTAPSGYKALVTTNLPDPTVIEGDEYFNTVLYTGNGSARSITGVGFQPDWVWIKKRNAAANHNLTDVLRGVDKILFTNSTNAESTFAGGLSSFNSDGFSLAGNDTGFNANGDTYVAWNWNAGGSTVTNTSGSISAQVRASTDAGFSIITFNGTGANATVGHGLGVAPSMVIMKQRNNNGFQWPVYHGSLGTDKFLFLQRTDGQFTSAAVWQNTAPSSSVVFLGPNGNDNNNTGSNMVAYCFAAIPGYSAFGSYTGNGSADGPFVFTGFRPAWVMIKSTGIEDWYIYDSVRNTFNVTNLVINANKSDAEFTATGSILDILSNGFKLRNTGGINGSGVTFIYMAFAENPFKFALAR